MSPFGYAMRLINRYEPDFGMSDHLDKAFIVETFRGNISVRMA